MYLEHFSLKDQPFRTAPEGSAVFMSQQHSKAFVYMDSSAWSPESFVVISGEVGSGKTTLLKKLMHSIDKNLKLIHIPYTNLEAADLFYLIARQAGIEIQDNNKIAMMFAIRDYLASMTRRRIPVVLAVDEAQNLSFENLEDIRMLAGLEDGSGAMMRVILLGQPELREAINAIPQLAQRVKLHFHLHGLSEEETGRYIAHRLHVSGYRGTPLFEGELISRIYQISRGIPRLINKICDGLMLCAYAEGRSHIEPNDIEEIRDDIMASDIAQTQDDVVSTTAQVARQGDNSEALERIASSLERLEQRFEQFFNRIDRKDSKQ
ncbi:ExeA family protein [Salinibius halmophilus]|uniref:ExeA family protein n=1 Tax=Salinibius halmophilus TaxID=1853216 RepID=UPI000E669335|nr:AAA family ATPase [Salinibius halmophilus]